MLVLGIDPGTIRMGYGLVRSGPDPTAEDFGVVVLPRSMPLERRLHQLYTHVLNMISIFQPDAISVEEPFVGAGDRRFAGPALALGQAQALVLIGGAGQGVPVFPLFAGPDQDGGRQLWGRHQGTNAGAALSPLSSLTMNRRRTQLTPFLPVLCHGGAQPGKRGFGRALVPPVQER